MSSLKNTALGFTLATVTAFSPMLAAKAQTPDAPAPRAPVNRPLSDAERQRMIATAETLRLAALLGAIFKQGGGALPARPMGPARVISPSP